jgi:hypothetical protein
MRIVGARAAATKRAAEQERCLSCGHFRKRGTQESNLTPRFWRPACCLRHITDAYSLSRVRALGPTPVRTVPRVAVDARATDREVRTSSTPARLTAAGLPLRARASASATWVPPRLRLESLSICCPQAAAREAKEPDLQESCVYRYRDSNPGFRRESAFERDFRHPPQLPATCRRCPKEPANRRLLNPARASPLTAATRR